MASIYALVIVLIHGRRCIHGQILGEDYPLIPFLSYFRRNIRGYAKWYFLMEDNSVMTQFWPRGNVGDLQVQVNKNFTGYACCVAIGGWWPKSRGSYMVGGMHPLYGSSWTVRPGPRYGSGDVEDANGIWLQDHEGNRLVTSPTKALRILYRKASCPGMVAGEPIINTTLCGLVDDLIHAEETLNNGLSREVKKSSEIRDQRDEHIRVLRWVFSELKNTKRFIKSKEAQEIAHGIAKHMVANLPLHMSREVYEHELAEVAK